MESQKILYVEIDGISYPAIVTLGAMSRFKELTGVEVNEMSGLDHTLKWLWCCVKSGSARTDNPLKMDCQEFLDCLTPDILAQWSDMIAEEADDLKKKTTKPRLRQ